MSGKAKSNTKKTGLPQAKPVIETRQQPIRVRASEQALDYWNRSMSFNRRYPHWIHPVRPWLFQLPKPHPNGLQFRIDCWINAALLSVWVGRFTSLHSFPYNITFDWISEFIFEPRLRRGFFRWRAFFGNCADERNRKDQIKPYGRSAFLMALRWKGFNLWFNFDPYDTDLYRNTPAQSLYFIWGQNIRSGQGTDQYHLVMSRVYK